MRRSSPSNTCCSARSRSRRRAGCRCRAPRRSRCRRRRGPALASASATTPAWPRTPGAVNAGLGRAVVVDRPAADHAYTRSPSATASSSRCSTTTPSAAADDGALRRASNARHRPSGEDRPPVLVEVADLVRHLEPRHAGERQVALAGHQAGAGRAHRDQRGGAVALHAVTAGPVRPSVCATRVVSESLSLTKRDASSGPTPAQHLGVGQQVVEQVGAQPRSPRTRRSARRSAAGSTPASSSACQAAPGTAAAAGPSPRPPPAGSRRNRRRSRSMSSSTGAAGT